MQAHIRTALIVLEEYRHMRTRFLLTLVAAALLLAGAALMLSRASATLAQNVPAPAPAAAVDSAIESCDVIEGDSEDGAPQNCDILGSLLSGDAAILAEPTPPATAPSIRSLLSR